MRVWLSAGQALVARGVRVTMVAAVDEPAHVVERAMTPGRRGRWRGSARACAGRARWRSRRCGRRRAQHGGVGAAAALDGEDVTWILVPEFVWTDQEAPPLRGEWATLPYPVGRGRQSLDVAAARQERAHEEMRRAGELFDQLCQWATGRISRARSWRGRAARAWRWKAIS